MFIATTLFILPQTGSNSNVHQLVNEQIRFGVSILLLSNKRDWKVNTHNNMVDSENVLSERK